MQQALRELEDADTTGQQRVEVVVRGVLHHREVRSLCRRHHHAHVDAAFHGLAHGLDGRRVGQEIRVLDPQPLARQAQHQVVQDLDRRGRTFGFDTRHVGSHVTRGLQRGEHVVADKQLTGCVDPVFAERRLHGMHHRTAQPHADVAHVFAVLRLTHPGVDDAMAAHQRHAAVEDGQLAVVATVDLADVAQCLAVEQLEPATGVLHRLFGRVAHLLAAVVVNQHPHLQAVASALRQGRGHPCAEQAFLPQKGLEVDRHFGAADVFEHRIEKGAVLEHFDRVAFDQLAVAQARHRRQHLFQRQITLDLQLGVGVALDRMQHQDQRGDDSRQHKQNPDRHGCRRQQQVQDQARWRQKKAGPPGRWYLCIGSERNARRTGRRP